MSRTSLTITVFFLAVFLPCAKISANGGEKKKINQETKEQLKALILQNNFNDSNHTYQSGMLMGNGPLQNPNEKPAWQIAMATNPLSLFLFNQIALSIDVIRAKTSHEFRYNYIKDANKLLWKTDLDPGFTLPQIKYSGYQLSYTLKFTKQRMFDRFKYLYQGPQIRYTHREYERIMVNLIHKQNKDTITDVRVDSKSQVFDLVYVTGQQVRWKLFFLDVYGGAGVGYKTMTANGTNGSEKINEFKELDNYDIRKENIAEVESRFKPTRWNRVYVPTRLGVRVGIIF